jgi:dTDP-4-amino-4,6-dideoxygalactose transaminase
MYIPPWPGLHLSQWAGSDAEPQPLPFPLSLPSAGYFVAARYAIYQLFRRLVARDPRPVLVPDYHHGNEVRAIGAAGVPIRFYSIGDGLQPDLNELTALCRDGASALYTIHYLGWPQPVRELRKLCDEFRIPLVEDCALSLLSMLGDKPLGSFGDYSVFCLYKTVPVPNGGILVRNRASLPEISGLPLRKCPAASVAGRTAELMLETARSRANGVGKGLFSVKRALGAMLRGARGNNNGVHVGDTGFNIAHADIAASSLTRFLLPRFAFAEIRRRRRANYERLARLLAGRTQLPVPALAEGICPLFLPVLVSDKRSAAERLWQRGIGAIEFWNGDGSEVPKNGSSRAAFFRAHVLEVPIHQDVSPAQLEHIAREVLRLDLL